MKPQTAIIKLRLRLNKSHSSDYDNIPDWVAVEAINKAALSWTRRQLHGSNKTQEGDEESRSRIDDLEQLLKSKSLKGKTFKRYFESNHLPEDYLWFKRIEAEASKDCYEDLILDSTLAEESNAGALLKDFNSQPSFDFEQCFHTLIGDKIRVYTNDDFFVSKINLIYYRKPIKMDIHGYEKEDASESANVDLEFKDDIAEIIIDEAASIIAGDIESINAFEINKRRVDENSP